MNTREYREPAPINMLRIQVNDLTQGLGLLRRTLDELCDELLIASETPTTWHQTTLRNSPVSTNSVTLFLERADRGDVVAKSIKDIVESHGLTISIDPQVAGIRCIATLEGMYHMSPDLMERTIRVAAAAWRGDRVSLRSTMMEGVAAFLTDAGIIDEEVLVRAMASLRPSTMVMEILGMKNQRLRIAEMIANAYVNEP